mmetsp:Transcript_7020/g.23302  ORF Transcript_7020/g.23302 Transcript_7020/m.23302 type:complete len:210 (-) Transcript_7020:38-667(-)
MAHKRTERRDSPTLQNRSPKARARCRLCSASSSAVTTESEGCDGALASCKAVKKTLFVLSGPADAESDCSPPLVFSHKRISFHRTSRQWSTSRSAPLWRTAASSTTLSDRCAANATKSKGGAPSCSIPASEMSCTAPTGESALSPPISGKNSDPASKGRNASGGGGSSRGVTLRSCDSVRGPAPPPPKSSGDSPTGAGASHPNARACAR